MIGTISGAYSYYGAYNPYMAVRGSQQADTAQGVQRVSVLAGRRAASPSCMAFQPHTVVPNFFYKF